MNQQIRDQFPILSRHVYNKPLVYFDNAATTQKPIAVIEALDNYYKELNSNIHRGVHFLSQEATTAYEKVREQTAQFINAPSSKGIIFTRGTTESINLVAHSYGSAFLKKGGEIVVSELEHHSNIVPWQLVSERYGAKLKVIPVDDYGVVGIEAFKKLLTSNTAIVAITHISNALGTIVPIKEVISISHDHGVPVLVDGAQGVPHLQVDVQDLDADFYCFSAHKMYGPMGIGVMYGKEELLNVMPPFQGGGEMIDKVSFEKTTYAELPFKFEAGTPNVGDAIAFGEAMSFIESVGIENISKHENHLGKYALNRLAKIKGFKLIGPSKERAGVVSFLIDGLHPYDIGVILDKFGIAVRTGNHCAQPIMDRIGVPGTIRASFAIYNTEEEVERLAEAVEKAQQMLQ